ncbi:helix-turn-helix domain-containing protein [Robertmurraya korlensis]|uniref:helix-turn-helix domain-containing protein n=1 Tax=Robertmurraya korlensis TaxID=519977 RepID=UPI002041E5AF|nr:helix-turn-helix transcriptional regulator [Robertmurraya korlensis]MCM3603134.1 helix-turn-helix domain-containing protein [Robertmurraya korlensis]
MNEFYKELGEKVNKYRKAINMSTTTLSELSGTSQSTISKIENGATATNIETLLKICEVLGITLYDILPSEIFPEFKITDPDKLQLLNVFNQMSKSELKLIQTFLTNILPTLKNLTSLIKALDQLSDEEREFLISFFDSISNN